MDTKTILDKVVKLIALAERTENPVEAATFREKAEGLMRQYRIEEEELIAVDQTSILPIRSDLQLCFSNSHFLQQYVNIAHYAAKHAGVRITWLYGRNLEGAQVLFGAFVGYEGDVRLAEYLFTAASLVFGERIDPSVNPSLSDVENIYRLRSAGITRRDVAQMLWGIDTHAAHAKVAKIYKEESDRRGERPALNGRGISAAQYRVAYAEEFCWTFSDRLRIARSASDASSGGATVLFGRQERVDEAFYGHFPYLRPKPKNDAEVEEVKEPTEAEKKAMARREAALQRKIDRGPTMAEMAADARRYSAASLAGRRAGGVAARAVDLGRGQAPRAGRIDEAPERERSAIEG